MTKDNEKINSYLSKALAVTEIKDNGKISWKIKGESDYFEDFEVYLEIICCNLQISELEHFSELEKFKVLIAAIGNLKKEGKDTATVEDLKEKIKSVIVEERQKPAETYNVLFFINIRQKEFEKNNFKFLNKDLALLTSEEMEEINFDKLLRHTRLHHPTLTELKIREFSMFKFKEKGKNPRDAFYNGADFLNSFVNWINAFDQLSTDTIMQTGRRKPLNKVLPPPGIGVFDEAWNLLELGFEGNPYEYKSMLKKNKLSKTLDEVEEISSLLQNEDFEINESIKKWLESFGEAFGNIKLENVYLNLWQILESIACPLGKDRTLRQVINRAALIFNQDSYVKDILNCLYKRRNDLVHEGKFPEDEGLIQINLLKFLLRRILGWIINLREEISTLVLLEEFYLNGSIPRKHLEAKKSMIEKILDEKIFRF